MESRPFRVVLKAHSSSSTDPLSSYHSTNSLTKGSPTVKSSTGRWQRYGKDPNGSCAEHDRPILLVIDELPIFLMRMLRDDEGARRVDEFLSWLRGVFQTLDGRSPILIASGRIGLAPLVQRLGIPDRINHLYPFRLGPWGRQSSVEYFERLTASHGLPMDDGVAEAVYEALGIGIPHHVQSYFAHLQDFVAIRNLDRVTVADVDKVYRTELLGPAGQSDSRTMRPVSETPWTETATVLPWRSSLKQPSSPFASVSARWFVRRAKCWRWRRIYASRSRRGWAQAAPPHLALHPLDVAPQDSFRFKSLGRGGQGASRSAILVNWASAASRSSAISAAMTPGGGNESVSVRLLSLIQKRSRPSLSRFSRSS